MTHGVVARSQRGQNPLVGRAGALASLEQLLDELERDPPAALELVGEAGIGKTRLLSELASRAEQRGHLVLAGSASELERGLPFSVFVHALDEYIAGLDPNDVAALDDDVQAELAHVFPSLSALGAGREVAPQHERYRSHRAVRALLEHLAKRAPFVLMLDDFHWADSASGELLAALLRRPPAAAVFIAIALRPRQIPQPLLSALERAHRAAALNRVELRDLTLAEARELLGKNVDAVRAAALFEECGGNPFYLEQLARSFERAGEVATTHKIWQAQLEVPAAVAASLSEELALLSDDALLVLEGAAVAGDPFEPELAAAAADRSEAAAMDAVDELLEVDLIRTTDAPRRFRFRHPLVRRAVYEATAAGWRLGAHERCADALGARGATPPVRAHHVELSARDGDLTAVGVLRDAGETATRLAPESAARWFGAALRLLPATAPTQERVELLLACAGALAASGRFAHSHEVLLEAVAIVPEQPSELATRAVTACAGVERFLGLYDQAHARLLSALQRVPDPASPESVELLIELTVNEFYRSRHTSMSEWAARAVSASTPASDTGLTAAALATLAEAMAGATETARARRDETAALVDALSDEELSRQPDAAAWLAAAELYLDLYAEADTHASRGLVLARATGRADRFFGLYQILPRIWYVRGRLTEAAEVLDGAIEAGHLLGTSPALIGNLFNRSAVAVAVGELDIALATAEEAAELTHGLDEGFVSAWAAVRFAAVLLETEQPLRAVELLLGSAGGEDLALIPGGWRVYCLDLLTRCWLALDRQDEAERAAALAASNAATVRLPLATAWADRAAAAVAFHAGDTPRAIQCALASADAAHEVEAPIESALSRTLAGRALAQAGQRDRAVAELERAVAAFDACGAVRYRERAERELGKLGHRTHRRSRAGNSNATGVDTLTGRELQVARLVVDRMTNPQIAAQLFLSNKTVETHLRNIFRKMDVASRVELAHAVEHADHSATHATAP
jgi:DNA-binding CsgD family transcriptional regulator